ncbi:MAG: hypothetical protein Q9186_005606 [Xanthomendoza sp. 1 TL-2023]
MSDPSVKLALRIHDECNGSDVFGSDICTCRPYLVFGVEEAVKEAQQGGSGVVVYFRKEGRALGEVTKYLVYNASASEYFHRTESIAGVKASRRLLQGYQPSAKVSDAGLVNHLQYSRT